MLTIIFCQLFCKFMNFFCAFYLAIIRWKAFFRTIWRNLKNNWGNLSLVIKRIKMNSLSLMRDINNTMNNGLIIISSPNTIEVVIKSYIPRIEQIPTLKLHASIHSIFQPILRKILARLIFCNITAFTTISFLRENDPLLWISNQMKTRTWIRWVDSLTDFVGLSVVPFEFEFCLVVWIVGVHYTMTNCIAFLCVNKLIKILAESYRPIWWGLLLIC